LKFEHLNKMSLAIDEFRSHFPDAPLLTFQIFLEVATSQGIGATELKRRSGASQSAISRHLLLLSTWTWQGKRPGLNLIEQYDTPNSRRKTVFLTNKGRLLACQLLRILDPGTEVTPGDFMPAKV